jgi:hypothetical protein
VALKLIYVMFSKLLGWMVLRTRSDTAKEIEILILRMWVPCLRVRGIYHMFAKLLSWMVLHVRSDTAKRSRSSSCAINWQCCSDAHLSC